MTLNDCLPLKERQEVIYLLMEVHSAISKMIVRKIKPESDKKSVPNYQLTGKTGSEQYANNTSKVQM